MVIEIVDLPIKNGDVPSFCMFTMSGTPLFFANESLFHGHPLQVHLKPSDGSDWFEGNFTGTSHDLFLVKTHGFPVKIFPEPIPEDPCMEYLPTLTPKVI